MQRILVSLAALAVMIAFTSPGAFAQAKKGKANCSEAVCTEQCIKNGGQIRGCGAYCTKQISDRKAQGKC